MGELKIEKLNSKVLQANGLYELTTILRQFKICIILVCLFAKNEWVGQEM